ncbi:carboxypeptidase B-like [Cyprinodon tularosa]|uniref:carboxypeptidase B-like n=1 Tax=Cyprinodon tularosa TaxID=77115 RepID=UPI0018E1FC44|nr:carboxypeptidase B-like [Cyprinodon tularosa]
MLLTLSTKTSPPSKLTSACTHTLSFCSSPTPTPFIWLQTMASGGSDDWAYDLRVKYIYTFVLGDNGHYGFLLPESEMKPICKETELTVKYITTHVQKISIKKCSSQDPC